jgi:hypothetical protein
MHRLSYGVLRRSEPRGNFGLAQRAFLAPDEWLQAVEHVALAIGLVLGAQLGQDLFQ